MIPAKLVGSPEARIIWGRIGGSVVIGKRMFIDNRKMARLVNFSY